MRHATPRAASFLAIFFVACAAVLHASLPTAAIARDEQLSRPLIAAEDLVARASELCAQGDFRGAIALLDHAIAADPQNSAAYRERGRARLEAKDWPGSLQDLEKATSLDLDPDFESPLLVYRLVPPLVKAIGTGTDPDSGERVLKVDFEPIPPGKDLEPADCLAGYRLVGRKPGVAELSTAAEILYTTDHLSEAERASWYESQAATKVEIEPGAKTALLPPTVAVGYAELGLQTIEGRLRANRAVRPGTDATAASSTRRPAASAA